MIGRHTTVGRWQRHNLSERNMNHAKKQMSAAISSSSSSAEYQKIDSTASAKRSPTIKNDGSSSNSKESSPSSSTTKKQRSEKSRKHCGGQLFTIIETEDESVESHDDDDQSHGGESDADDKLWCQQQQQQQLEQSLQSSLGRGEEEEASSEKHSLEEEVEAAIGHYNASPVAPTKKPTPIASLHNGNNDTNTPLLLPPAIAEQPSWQQILKHRESKGEGCNNNKRSRKKRDNKNWNPPSVIECTIMASSEDNNGLLLCTSILSIDGCFDATTLADEGMFHDEEFLGEEEGEEEEVVTMTAIPMAAGKSKKKHGNDHHGHDPMLDEAPSSLGQDNAPAQRKEGGSVPQSGLSMDVVRHLPSSINDQGNDGPIPPPPLSGISTAEEIIMSADDYDAEEDNDMAISEVFNASLGDFGKIVEEFNASSAGELLLGAGRHPPPSADRRAVFDASSAGGESSDSKLKLSDAVFDASDAGEIRNNSSNKNQEELLFDASMGDFTKISLIHTEGGGGGGSSNTADNGIVDKSSSEEFNVSCLGIAEVFGASAGEFSTTTTTSDYPKIEHDSSSETSENGSPREMTPREMMRKMDSMRTLRESQLKPFPHEVLVLLNDDDDDDDDDGESTADVYTASAGEFPTSYPNIEQGSSSETTDNGSPKKMTSREMMLKIDSGGTLRASQLKPFPDEVLQKDDGASVSSEGGESDESSSYCGSNPSNVTEEKDGDELLSLDSGDQDHAKYVNIEIVPLKTPRRDSDPDDESEQRGSGIGNPLDLSDRTPLFRNLSHTLRVSDGTPLGLDLSDRSERTPLSERSEKTPLCRNSSHGKEDNLLGDDDGDSIESDDDIPFGGEISRLSSVENLLGDKNSDGEGISTSALDVSERTWQCRTSAEMHDNNFGNSGTSFASYDRSYEENSERGGNNMESMESIVDEGNDPLLRFAMKFDEMGGGLPSPNLHDNNFEDSGTITSDEGPRIGNNAHDDGPLARFAKKFDEMGGGIPSSSFARTSVEMHGNNFEDSGTVSSNEGPRKEDPIIDASNKGGDYREGMSRFSSKRLLTVKDPLSSDVEDDESQHGGQQSRKISRFSSKSLLTARDPASSDDEDGEAQQGGQQSRKISRFSSKRLLSAQDPVSSDDEDNESQQEQSGQISKAGSSTSLGQQSNQSHALSKSGYSKASSRASESRSRTSERSKASSRASEQSKASGRTKASERTTRRRNSIDMKDYGDIASLDDSADSIDFRDSGTVVNYEHSSDDGDSSNDGDDDDASSTSSSSSSSSSSSHSSESDSMSSSSSSSESTYSEYSEENDKENSDLQLVESAEDEGSAKNANPAEEEDESEAVDPKSLGTPEYCELSLLQRQNSRRLERLGMDDCLDRGLGLDTVQEEEGDTEEEEDEDGVEKDKSPERIAKWEDHVDSEGESALSKFTYRPRKMLKRQKSRKKNTESASGDEKSDNEDDKKATSMAPKRALNLLRRHSSRKMTVVGKEGESDEDDSSSEEGDDAVDACPAKPATFRPKKMLQRQISWRKKVEKALDEDPTASTSEKKADAEKGGEDGADSKNNRASHPKKMLKRQGSRVKKALEEVAERRRISNEVSEENDSSPEDREDSAEPKSHSKRMLRRQGSRVKKARGEVTERRKSPVVENDDEETTQDKESRIAKHESKKKLLKQKNVREDAAGKALSATAEDASRQDENEDHQESRGENNILSSDVGTASSSRREKASKSKDNIPSEISTDPSSQAKLETDGSPPYDFLTASSCDFTKETSRRPKPSKMKSTSDLTSSITRLNRKAGREKALQAKSFSVVEGSHYKIAGVYFIPNSVDKGENNAGAAEDRVAKEDLLTAENLDALPEATEKELLAAQILQALPDATAVNSNSAEGKVAEDGNCEKEKDDKVQEEEAHAKTEFLPKKILKISGAKILKVLDDTAEKVASVTADIAARPTAKSISSRNVRRSPPRTNRNHSQYSRKDMLARERAMKRREEQMQQQHQQQLDAASLFSGVSTESSIDVEDMTKESSIDVEDTTKSSEEWSDKHEVVKDPALEAQRRALERVSFSSDLDHEYRHAKKDHRRHRSVPGGGASVVSGCSRGSRVSDSSSFFKYQSSQNSAHSQHRGADTPRFSTSQSQSSFRSPQRSQFRGEHRHPRHQYQSNNYSSHNNGRGRGQDSAVSWGDLDHAIEEGCKTSIMDLNEQYQAAGYDYHPQWRDAGSLSRSVTSQYTEDYSSQTQHRNNYNGGGSTSVGGGEQGGPVSWDDLDDAIQVGLQSSIRDLTFHVVEQQEWRPPDAGNQQNEYDSRPWQCAHCTFVNENGSFLLCGVCNNSRS